MKSLSKPDNGKKKENISQQGTNHPKLISWKYSEYNSMFEKLYFFKKMTN